MTRNSACNFDVASVVRVRCTAGKGMLPHEAGVLIRGKDQFYESMIDSELVHPEGEGGQEGEEWPATIDAVVINVNCENVLVELPRQVVAGGRRIWVPMSEVAKHGDSVKAGH